jgi:hypothetical protein
VRAPEPPCSRRSAQRQFVHIQDLHNTGCIADLEAALCQLPYIGREEVLDREVLVELDSLVLQEIGRAGRRQRLLAAEVRAWRRACAA